MKTFHVLESNYKYSIKVVEMLLAWNYTFTMEHSISCKFVCSEIAYKMLTVELSDFESNTIVLDN